ncbi:MAG TPA: type II toxin-antitoxin system Phd/YefM family antitoxin [bacterium]
MRAIPLSKAKTRLPTLVRSLQGKRGSLKITEDGKTTAILVSPAEYESWTETVAIMSDKQLMRDIRKGMKEKKRIYTEKELDELFGIEK